MTNLRVEFPIVRVDDLDPFIQGLVLEDAQQGARQRDQVLRLFCEQNLSEEDAKARVLPNYRRGCSFADVYMRASGRPTYVTFGAAAREDFDGAFAPLDRRLAMALALLGLSNVSGGGPGRMKRRAEYSHEAIQATEPLGFTRRFDPQNFRVLLKTGKEEPNGFCPDEHTVWPIDKLDVRTPMLLALGMPIVIFVDGGGWGTDEEESRVRCATQLRKHITTPFGNHVPPIVYLDFETTRRGPEGVPVKWFDYLFDHMEVQKAYGVIKPEDLSHLHRLDVRSHDSLARILALVNHSSKEVLGVGIVTQWEEDNGRSLIEAVDTLLQQ